MPNSLTIFLTLGIKTFILNSFSGTIGPVIARSMKSKKLGISLLLSDGRLTLSGWLLNQLDSPDFA
jgi:hypothetical protein